MRQLKITKQITQRSTESINRYFNEIAKYTVLSPEEEVELTTRIKKGDIVALEKLVVANLRFVVSVAKQYQNHGISFSDLINEGNYGLVKAAKKFDETRGFKFISYAVWWIRQAIIQAISEQSRIVRLPLNRLTSIQKITRALPYLEQEFERAPTNEELASFLELNDEEIRIANNIKSPQVSFDTPLNTNNDSESNLYDIIQTENIPSPDNHLMKESAATNMLRLVNKLPVRECEIITMSFGIGGTKPYRLNEIAERMDMSSERVRQIKSKALIRLKSIMNGKYSFLDS